MTEQLSAATFFTTKFAADTGAGGIATLAPGRYYEDVAAAKTAFPCIIFNYYSGSDLATGYGRRMLTNAIYLVRACGRGYGYADAGVEALAERIDIVLQEKSDDYVLFCERMSPFNRSYTIDGVTYYERGGFYRLRINGG